jgi:hypothetical protein
MPAKKSSAVKVVQRLDFVIEKAQLQNLLRDDKAGPSIKINFGIDYDQKIWVSASSSDSNQNERPSSFAQKLVFSISKKSVRDVLKKVRQAGSVRISMVISDDQKLWVALSPKKGDQTTPQSIKRKTVAA